MQIIDLSHEIHSQIPVYPGTEPPVFTPTNSIVQDGFAETLISMYSHTATHMDAPAHILSAGRTLDQFPVEQFFGSACIADVSQVTELSITVTDLQPVQQHLEEVDFLLLKTGWSQRWGRESYFNDFPSLSVAAAEWLSGFKLKGVGIDAISIDPVSEETLPAHHRLLEKNILIIENLTCLEKIISDRFYFSSLPLKLRAADGSPVRAVAIEDFVI